MVMDFVESRVAHPVKLAEWGEVEEAQAVVCGCCGWSGPLGECALSSVGDARAYACGQCAMALVVRAYPNVVGFPRTPQNLTADIERFVANL